VANGGVQEAVADNSGNLYIADSFTIVGDVFVANIAKWNGTNWSALSSGMEPNYCPVYALAVSSNVCGGYFTNAGGISANYIAQWSAWPPLA